MDQIRLCHQLLVLFRQITKILVKAASSSLKSSIDVTPLLNSPPSLCFDDGDDDDEHILQIKDNENSVEDPDVLGTSGVMCFFSCLLELA